MPEAPRDLSDFVLGTRLGSGTMADVYRARDLRANCDVALKILRAQPDRDTQAHFLREMTLTARLVHPHIVRTLAAGRSGERLWLAMELVDGPTLEDRLRDGVLPTREALEIGRQVLSALSYTHRLGVVHRDIKPANILLSETGAKLGDFGFAKSLGDLAAASLTITGHMKGTPRYMPREQLLNAKRAGPRADLFAVAACLHYALTRCWHYDAGMEDLWGAILTGDPVPLRRRRPDVPAAMAAPIDRALSLRPEDRPASADAMLAELNRVPS